MAQKLSRRNLATYVADHWTEQSHTKVVRQLAAYLVETRRTKELDLIVRDVDYLLSERGVVNARITSAFDLSAETNRAIKQLVKERTGAKTVTTHSETNPSLLGGFKVQLPGRELDRTIAHQLTVLRTRFKKA